MYTVFPKLVGDEQSKVFKSDGGVLFNFQHGVLIEVPPGAVKEGESVKMKVYIAVPDKRMDLCSEWGRLYPVSLPVVVVTDPPGHIFLKPIKLRIPHCGVYEPNWQPQNIAVLTSSFDLPLKSQLEFRRLPEDAIEVKDRHVVIRLFNFSWFWVFTEKAVFSRQCTVALYTPSDQYIRQTQDRFHAKIFVFPKLHFCSSVRTGLHCTCLTDCDYWDVHSTIVMFAMPCMVVRVCAMLMPLCLSLLPTACYFHSTVLIPTTYFSSANT